MKTDLEPKYRITITLTQLDYIISLLAKEKGNMASNLETQFKKLAVKSQLGILAPAYVAKKKLVDSIGPSDDEMRYLAGEMTPEEEIEFQASLLR